MRILKWLVGGLLVVALLLGGAFVWGVQRVSRARAARVEALGPLLARATAVASLSPEEACLVVEGHYMKRSTVLTADCRRATLEVTGPGVVKFRGLVVADAWDDALLGGGYVPTLCLSKGPRGWEVAGFSHQLLDCQFDAPTGPEPAKEALAQVERRRRAWVDDAFVAVRDALTRPASDKAVCEGLPALSKWDVLVLDADLLGEDLSSRLQRTTRIGDMLGYQCIPAMMGQGLNLGPCAANQFISHVVVIDDIDERPLEVVGSRYSGGRYAAMVKLVDVRKHEVLCQREVSFQLPEKLLLVKRQDLNSEYRKQVRAALHQAVEQLTQGSLTAEF
ncbi:hypothetical protein A176_001658 [Myxococcus hansupus]|uniref:Uncharacterized protein n=1 Tax=Pseudomyxococcus hansupus TaxID=1297742 RepID=A0A0H4WMV1_9BACT|nr:hypothetical protein [Myxococcus hansupus]AKQ64746.1 hypothetical protein A176_001658 [Myxococcus hansupus]